MRRIIEILPMSNGAHRNQTGDFDAIPEGFAEIPVGLTVPDTFPFVNITALNGIVTSITAGHVPEPTPTPAPTDTERLRADVDYIAIMTNVDLGEV